MPRKADPAQTGLAVGKLIGYQFSKFDTLMRALTHSSADSTVTGNYERLEFLGDRILGLVIAELLFAEFPTADEGELSRRFNQLVNAETCADIADDLGLGEFVITGVEIRSLKGRKRLNLRADVAESLIAAIYLDGGMEPAREFIMRHWAKRVHATDADRRDAKTELQEWAHRSGKEAPFYEVESRKGPDHDPEFTVKATVEGFEPERGNGSSKREAERAAAEAILIREGVWMAEATSK